MFQTFHVSIFWNSCFNTDELRWSWWLFHAYLGEIKNIMQLLAVSQKQEFWKYKYRDTHNYPVLRRWEPVRPHFVKEALTLIWLLWSRCRNNRHGYGLSERRGKACRWVNKSNFYNYRQFFIPEAISSYSWATIIHCC